MSDFNEDGEDTLIGGTLLDVNNFKVSAHADDHQASNRASASSQKMGFQQEQPQVRQYHNMMPSDGQMMMMQQHNSRFGSSVNPADDGQQPSLALSGA